MSVRYPQSPSPSQVTLMDSPSISVENPGLPMLQHQGSTPPLSPHTPTTPYGDWEELREVQDGVENEGLRPWGVN